MSNKPTEAAARRQAMGRQAEDRALAYLEHQGLRLVRRHYQVARGPSRAAGEIDLIMRDRDGTLVFVEVRARTHTGYGGAAASVGPAKKRTLIWTAQHYLRQLVHWPPCRFDVVAITAEALTWLPAAFEVNESRRL